MNDGAIFECHRLPLGENLEMIEFRVATKFLRLLGKELTSILPWDADERIASILTRILRNYLHRYDMKVAIVEAIGG
jgi:hypothetical protein